MSLLYIGLILAAAVPMLIFLYAVALYIQYLIETHKEDSNQ